MLRSEVRLPTSSFDSEEEKEVVDPVVERVLEIAHVEGERWNNGRLRRLDLQTAANLVAYHRIFLEKATDQQILRFLLDQAKRMPSRRIRRVQSRRNSQSTSVLSKRR